ncbi:HAD family hydrolase [Sphingobacterium spiritivorum]|uniref:HAD hydrolase, family IA, variant 3 n=1 Tax=Sphingobacterium spiritivorum ATCC 33861 TaxID=525373 RepID=D7VQA0_SPHSI|nr:HAD family phosphatase [Sphingobacterium spiritivorum]EFK55951.1 HAD hydrolase, family IA, variant 3 [Sphingobacterium spiritivorum ATCC 33861]QQT35915.1 HAD family phosphatase [Sphingobacterium spiritivorum]WQD32643.1 HAD family phosphatase [Sphingobacterium spiritivorum]SUJ12336.1 Phosphatase YqaB [Sphingobacterium spiritivorum]
MTSESQRKLQKLQEITAPYEALLYDVDGTLADNMLAHKLSYKAAAAEYGVDLNTDLIDETAGWPTVAVAKEIARRYQTTFDFEVFSKRKSAIFIERFIQNTQPVDYVLAHLLANEGIKRIGIVSGGSRSTLQITLKVIDVEGRFETLVCAGDTPKGKPDPAPFLLAAEQLGVDPQKCIVLEDGDPGVQGAINAGMGWVRIDQL